MPSVAVVTGAFSNIGRVVAGVLRDRGWTVRTLTNRRPGAGDPPLDAFPLRFPPDDAALRGADVLVNTYWVRMPEHGATFEDAVANSRILIDAAVAAGVRRFVQVSVSNASAESPLGYYRGKARVEEHVRESARSWAIVRPTLVVGPRDVLTGNIAWLVRRLPFVAIAADGEYPLQPVVLDDVARIIADQAESTSCVTLDAAARERFTFRQYVALIARAVGHRPRIVGAPPAVVLALLGVLGRLLGDVVLTREELLGLRDGMLVSRRAPTAESSVSAWLLAHGDALGRRYTNDRAARLTSRSG
jgi:nucleoside-diphosphate-sugar epimerase